MLAPVTEVIIYNDILIRSMPPKLTITGIPARFQSIWRPDSTLNRGEEAPIQTSTIASGFSSGEDDTNDDDTNDDDTNDNNTNDNDTNDNDTNDNDNTEPPPLQTPITLSNIQGRPQKRKRSQEEEDILQGKGKTRALSPNEYIILLKICLWIADTYRTAEAATFFKNVTSQGERAIKRLLFG
ncbi:hypothetical protein VC83_02391 [Pseudogymnoascus destructans]|uniref:Uncharacterized protein n=2 Tax=Pseudogymnoascus destructans TaxID=655981 RepID=L8G220_PSED2|nr:uncharacterized protein VC83_02391 [Pseudogymnoascus destructans]ELR07147.1 hypothetical protein GMDG_02415 [Pseudogymnoascus destructans 20631-21]OAF61117.1 hypothetical protein VC83_02391 [Pseudogymnoascus destructans]